MSNRLKGERSRYLLQHAENPVDWYPWSDAAFERAARENKPVLVSIGYSSCHWCHVMAHESFENADIAAVINDGFIAVKVDKEELPDVDGFYMEFLTRLAGRGGWPLNVFVNANRAPFYGLTYAPKRQLEELLPYLKTEFDKKEELRTQTIDGIFAVSRIGSEKIKSLLAAVETEPPRHEPGPQFPQGIYLRYLLRRGMTAPVIEELGDLIQKGMFDHIEGGWFRYSVDADFRIPHFEKMLYDQASLLLVCAEAHASAPGLCRYAIEKTFGWLETHMRLQSGLYGSATDADTEEGEGFYYTEGKTDDPIARALFRLDDCGVHEGRFLPWIDLAYLDAHRAEAAALVARIAGARALRRPPGLDGKAVVSWNCFLGYALARCADVLEDERIGSAALALHAHVSAFVSTRVPHVIYGTDAHESPDYLEDYAAYLLFSAALERKENDTSVDRLIGGIKERFSRQGYLFHTAEPIFENLSLWQDTPTPSGGAMLLTALLDLGRADLEGLDTLGIAEVAAKNPTFFAMWCSALERAYERRSPDKA